MKNGKYDMCTLLCINILCCFTIVCICTLYSVHTFEIYLLWQKLCYNEAKCYSRHSFIISYLHSHLIPTIYTSVKLEICAARRTYKRQPFISKKNTCYKQRESMECLGIFLTSRVNASYKRRRRACCWCSIRKSYGCLEIWGLCCWLLMLSLYTTIAFITIFIIFAFCKCFTVNTRFARKTFL